MAEKRILGSIYLDGVVQERGFVCDESTNISIGDTVPGKELLWVVADSRLVADRCACCDINWTQINRAGYNVGRPVFIDGKPYECRSLSVVQCLGQTISEWDELLDEFGEDNLLWHWKDKVFLGKRNHPLRRTIGQISSPRVQFFRQSPQHWIPARSGAAASGSNRPQRTGRQKNQTAWARQHYHRRHLGIF